MALLWLVNLGCIDLNPWQSRADAPDAPHPRAVRPRPGRRAALRPGWSRRPCWCATRSRRRACAATRAPRGPAGSTSWCRSRPGPRSRRCACSRGRLEEALVRRGRTSSRRAPRVAGRGPRVYLDHNQNGRGRSISSVYSVRPRPGPVATPLRWEEVRAGLDPATSRWASWRRGWSGRRSRRGAPHRPPGPG